MRILKEARIFDYGRTLAVIATEADGTLTGFRLPASELLTFLDKHSSVSLTSNFKAEIAA